MELQPGQFIDELLLVDEFGVSRTPVREALIKLESDGLVTIIPNRGAHVAQINLNDVREFFEAFDLCQRAVTRWAALRRRPVQLAVLRRHADEYADALAGSDVTIQAGANMAFHAAIAACCGNAEMERIYNGLLARSARIAQLALRYLSENESPAYNRSWLTEEHHELIRLISEGDAAGAERVAHSHSMRFLDVVARVLTDLDRDVVIAPSEDLQKSGRGNTQTSNSRTASRSQNQR